MCNSSSVTDYLLNFGDSDLVVGEAAVVLLPQVLQIENRREQCLEIDFADPICGHCRGSRRFGLRNQAIAIDRHDPLRGTHRDQAALSNRRDLQLSSPGLRARGLGFEGGLLDSWRQK